MAPSDTAADRHRRHAGAFSDRVRGTRDWTVPAPVAGWTARDVVRHLVEWLPGFLAAGDGISLPGGASRVERGAGGGVAVSPCTDAKAFSPVRMLCPSAPHARHIDGAPANAAQSPRHSAPVRNSSPSAVEAKHPPGASA